MNDYSKNYLNHDTLDDVFQNLFGWPVIPLVTRHQKGGANCGTCQKAAQGFHRGKDGNYLLHLAVPGIKTSDLNIELKDGTITIKGETKVEENEDAFMNSVEAVYTLPEDADATQLKAKLADGVLTLQVPPKEKKEPLVTRIAIE